jgi:hypothetical protein
MQHSATALHISSTRQCQSLDCWEPLRKAAPPLALGLLVSPVPGMGSPDAAGTTVLSSLLPGPWLCVISCEASGYTSNGDSSGASCGVIQGISALTGDLLLVQQPMPAGDACMGQPGVTDT